MDQTPNVLRNRGIPVFVAAVTALPSGENWSVVLDDEGQPVTEELLVRFDGNGIADIEEAFGSLEAYEQALEGTVFSTVRKTLAIAWNLPVREIGVRMLPGKIDEYATAIGVALALANGVDPTQAARLLALGVSAGHELQLARTEMVREMVERNLSPGDTGSDSGSSTEEATTTSGA